MDRAIHRRGRISETTRRQILDKASAMGYIDDKITRFTTLKKKVQILALFPESPSFFYDMMKTGLNTALKEQNDSLVELKIVDYDPEDSAGFLNILKSSMQEDTLKGVLLVPSGHFDSSLTLPGTAEIPYITINTDLPESKRCCFIGQDLYQSGRLGGELIHKFSSEGKLLVLSGYNGLWAHDERVRGVEDLFNELDPGKDKTVLYCDDNINTAEELVYNAIDSDHDFSGVLTLTAASTLGAVHALKSLDVKERISLVGYDFNKELSNALDDGYCEALIGQNPELQGAYAFKLMYRILFNDQELKKEFYVTPTELYLKELKPDHNSIEDF